ncbi:hypothetical protein NDU88_006818 [Pleurodeles waltl]|uniref:Uncharacterized protein n=1 Tax=Pleurodeles waltl TaxID=8319 RepID=A0AAV7UNN5_PLEWA|nr:hypothetical protein NDU88_006818 [Pleurodeles waltl]
MKTARPAARPAIDWGRTVDPAALLPSTRAVLPPEVGKYRLLALRWDGGLSCGSAIPPSAVGSGRSRRAVPVQPPSCLVLGAGASDRTGGREAEVCSPFVGRVARRERSPCWVTSLGQIGSRLACKLVGSSRRRR